MLQAPLIFDHFEGNEEPLEPTNSSVNAGRMPDVEAMMPVIMD
jgi:hypothetical protein